MKQSDHILPFLSNVNISLRKLNNFYIILRMYVIDTNSCEKNAKKALFKYYVDSREVKLCDV